MRIITSLAVCLLSAGAVQVSGAERFRLGAQLGFAYEQGNLLGSRDSSNTRLLMLQPQASVALIQRGTSPVLELVNEMTFAQSLRPSSRLIMAVNDGFRFHMRPTRNRGAYLELGAGIGSSALHIDSSDERPLAEQEFRQLNGWMQYHLQSGGGIRINVGRSRVHVGYRLTHFSNNNTQKPNLGLNMHTIVINWQRSPFS